MNKDYFSIKYCYSGEEDKIPVVLDSYDNNQLDLTNVNRILELYNIKLFFDKYNNVNGWSEEKYQKYKKLTDGVEDIVRNYFVHLTEETIVKSHDECEVEFWDDYWSFFYKFKVYDKIEESHFADIVEKLRMSPNSVLTNKGFVSRFDEQISELLRNPDFGARFIVDYYLRKSEETERYYFPKSLSKEDKYNTVIKYLDGEVVNANILSLILNGKSRNPKEFDLDDKLRYLSKKRLEKYWQENKNPMIKREFGVNVSFSLDNPDSEKRFVDGKIIAKYNSNWIKDNLDYPTLLNNFIYLFEYVDSWMRCSLTARYVKQGVFERLLSVNGNGMYEGGQLFELINSLANSQMCCYIDILKTENIFVEEIIKWFFEEYLKSEFHTADFICSMPAKTDSLLSKYERVASAMDGITKQFKMFCEDNEINRELYEMGSGSIRYRDIPSLIDGKYAYACCEELYREMEDFFSSQKMLSYTERTKSKYDTFFDLLINEKINFEDIEKYNSEEVDWLEKRGAVRFENGTIELNFERLYILKELYDRGVICLKYIDSPLLLALIESGEITVENTLLSRAESEYFDYILNKSEFSNGLDLRNKYIHNTHSLDEKQQYQDYIILLKLFIILVIKINEEFCLNDELHSSKIIK